MIHYLVNSSLPTLENIEKINNNNENILPLFVYITYKSCCFQELCATLCA